jgi:hypothetical protein
MENHSRVDLRCRAIDSPSRRDNEDFTLDVLKDVSLEDFDDTVSFMSVDGRSSSSICPCAIL